MSSPRKRKHSEAVTSESSTRTVPTWQTMPDDISAIIIGYLDYQSRLSLRKCGRRERKLVNSMAKQNVDICLEQKQNTGEKITITVSVPLENSKNGTMFSCEVSELECPGVMAIKKQYGSYDEDTRQPSQYTRGIPYILAIRPWFSKETDSYHDESLSQVVFQVFVQLLEEPIFQVKTLRFSLEKYDGKVYFGQNNHHFEKLVFYPGLQKNTIESILLNRKIDFDHFSHKKGEKNILKPDAKMRKFYQDLLDKREENFEIIKCVEKCYNIEFPIDYKVQSFEDGLSRLHNFSSKVLNKVMPIEIDVFHNQLGYVNHLMFLRAAFSNDPVSFLQSSCEYYSDNIELLRDGIENTTLREASLGMLFLVYIVTNVRETRKIKKNVCELLKSLCESSDTSEDGSLLIEKIGKLTKKSTDGKCPLFRYRPPSWWRRLSVVEADGSGNSQESWQTMPNEIITMITEYLDYPSRLSLRKCGRRERKTVNSLTKLPVNVHVTNDHEQKMHINVHNSDCQTLLKYTFMPFGRSGYRVIKHLAVNRNIQQPLGSGRSNRVFKGNYLEAAFGIVGQLLADPILDVDRLILAFKDFEETVNFGQMFMNIETLDFNKCLHAETIRSILSNVNLRFENMTKIGYQNLNSETKTRIFMLMDTLMEERNRNIKIIDSTEKLYGETFPLDYKVQSFEDGLTRLRFFSTKILKELADVDLDVFQKNHDLALDLMLLRAAFSRDPVTFFQSSWDVYDEKISLLRHGIEKIPLRFATLAMLSLVYIVTKTRKIMKIRQEVLEAFKILLKSDKQSNDYDKFIKEKLAKLRDIRIGTPATLARIRKVIAPVGQVYENWPPCIHTKP